MNIGITFGAYCPLHQGHLDVIMKAKKQNDICFVFVAGYDDDRGGDLLPLNQRYTIIKDFLSCENVIVEYINDTELGLDESMSDSNWTVWLDYLHQIIKKYRYDIYLEQLNWYVSEAPYKTQILRYGNEHGIKTNCDLLDRTKNPISGTLCRTEPLKHWKYITAPFRSYYSHNILIAGTASEGKTTLTQDIGKYFNLPYSYEKGRDNCKFKPDYDLNVKDFIYNIYEQHKYNEQLISSPQNPGVFVSDTDNLVTLMYAYFYSKRENFKLSEDDYNLLYNLARAYEKTTKWDKIFLLKPATKPIVDDGERYLGDSDYEIRCEFYEFLKNLYTDFGYEYEELQGGDYYNNFERVKNYIKSLYKE